MTQAAMEVTLEEEEAWIELEAKLTNPGLTSQQKKEMKMNQTTYTLYRATNTVNGRTYIGMTTNLKRRKWKHMFTLNTGTHCNKHMQKDWDEGNMELTFEVIHTDTSKSFATFMETELMNAEPNPYNIRKGNPGDMPHQGRRNVGIRAYIYKEVSELKNLYNYRTDRLMEMFGLGQPMVSMICTGARTAPAPQTSFANVLSCEATVVKAARKKRSEIKTFYAKGGV